VVRAVQKPQWPVLHELVHKPSPEFHKSEGGEGDANGGGCCHAEVTRTGKELFVNGSGLADNGACATANKQPNDHLSH
jgi:hypothetical protein